MRFVFNLNEDINCFDKIKTYAVIDPVTATAIEFSNRRAKENNYIEVDKNGFDGAPKQPKPQKVEIPKPMKK